ncbi:MAG: DNA primase DnaG [Candidatus Aenigmarchaeota archaeon]|nr:DNA primase DnaG [Candidatus Aenigmarchaeota archaeon]
MAKLAQNFAKYVIYAKLQAKGVVEKPDVIGAIFGQTEGLLGTDLDLRDLQHTGRIGRIEVNVKTDNGKSWAEIIIPSSLDASETALIGASMETIDKVGPCDAQITVTKVEDVRTQKRQYVINRAKEILRAMMDQGLPDTEKISETVKEAVRTLEVSTYNGLSCGPGIETEEEIIIVEGRADVINLLKNGVRNVIAIEGSKIPQPVINLTKEKTTIAFLDGDRGGDLDLKKLLAIADIDFVARAEEGSEVEELTKKQIYKALREKVPASQAFERQKEFAPEEIQDATEEITEETDEKTKSFLSQLLDDLIGTRAAYLVDADLQIISKVPLSEIIDIIGDYANVYALVFDGKINQSMVDLAKQRNIKFVVGMGFKEHIDAEGIHVLTMKDLR